MNRAMFAGGIVGMAAFAFGGADYVNHLVLPGNLTDLSGDGPGANQGRVGYFSDMYFDQANNVYYGLSDRGPGGGLLSYAPRVQKFTVNVNPATGAISNFNITQTIKFKQASGALFNGLRPDLTDGTVGGPDNAILGNAFDPEGISVNPANGHMYISDEYGPSLYEFDAAGTFVRALNAPANIIPRDAAGGLNFAGDRASTTPPRLETGRQDNRGFEGVTLSPDGSKLLAVMQAPLVNDSPTLRDGRSSRNVRIVEFDTATGNATKQYAYQLDLLAGINAAVAANAPAGVNAPAFTATQQGRSIGLSSIIPFGNSGTEYLVIERDNRGFGVTQESTTGDGQRAVGTKRIYKINIAGASDVSSVAFTTSNTDLPLSIVPVAKQLYLDIFAELTENDVVIGEKFEGVVFGPTLADGRPVLIVGTDNDYSVTQTGAGLQQDVFTNGIATYGNTFTVGAIDSAAPAGSQLIPGLLYSFAVPEPSALALVATVPAMLLRRRR